VARDATGALVTAGGRVLTVVATGRDVAAAADAAHAAADEIRFAGAQRRRDIGRSAVPAGARE
jgi:phosphoribosylamine--glycine ligase